MILDILNIEICTQEKFGLKLTLVSVSRTTRLSNPKKGSHFVYRKVVSLNFGFYSLENEQNFLSSLRGRAVKLPAL